MTPDTSLFRPTPELLADFRSSKRLASGKRFSLTEIANDLSVTNPRAGQLARHLLEEGILTRVLDGEGVFFIRRTRNALARHSWRKLSNEQIGIMASKPLGQCGR